MLGKNPGWVTSQGEILSALFQEAGYFTRLTSPHPGRLRRLLDTVITLLSWHNQVDILILMVFSGPAFVMADISSRLARLIGRPLIIWLHGGNLPAFSNQHPQWVRSVLRRANAIVSPSAYLAAHFTHWGFDVRVIPNVLEIAHYPYRHRNSIEPRLLWMRTFEDLYHPEMAVEALYNLRQTHPHARLTMAGQEKGSQAAVKSLVKARGLQEHVRFPGFLSMQGKQHEFQTHDIFLNTNRVDNMPVSIIEAAAFGLPVVTTEVGGIPYLLSHEKTALLVPNENSEAMADAVRKLLDRPSLAACLSTNGRALAEQSSWTIVRTQWEQLLERLL